MIFFGLDVFFRWCVFFFNLGKDVVGFVGCVVCVGGYFIIVFDFFFVVYIIGLF